MSPQGPESSGSGKREGKAEQKRDEVVALRGGPRGALRGRSRSEVTNAAERRVLEVGEGRTADDEARAPLASSSPLPLPLHHHHRKAGPAREDERVVHSTGRRHQASPAAGPPPSAPSSLPLPLPPVPAQHALSRARAFDNRSAGPRRATRVPQPQHSRSVYPRRPARRPQPPRHPSPSRSAPSCPAPVRQWRHGLATGTPAASNARSPALR